MELSMTMLSQICVLGATGVAAVVTMVDLYAGKSRVPAPRANAHGRARRR